MSINDPEQLKFSAIVGTVWNILMAAGAVFIGLVGRVYFPEATMLPGADTENLYPVLAQYHLHPILFGIVVASIFAAIMSTADSQLLVAASSIVRDIYENVLNKGKELSPKKLVLYSRIIVVVLVIIAMGLGLIAEDLVFWLVLFAWAGLGASIGPASILALYWRNCTRNGIIAGLIGGTFITILWKNIPFLKGLMYELVPAFFFGFIAIIIVSKFSKKPDGVDTMFNIMENQSP
jgi:Na+/proline symporter